MRSRRTSLALSFALAAVPLVLAQNSPTSPPQAAAPAGAQARGGRSNPTALRGRSITLGDVTAFDVKDNVATVSAGPDRVRVIFYRNDIVRLWLGPDGQFTDAQPNAADAQIVVYRGAPIAFAWRDA